MRNVWLLILVSVVLVAAAAFLLFFFQKNQNAGLTAKLDSLQAENLQLRAEQEELKGSLEEMKARFNIGEGLTYESLAELQDFAEVIKAKFKIDGQYDSNDLLVDYDALEVVKESIVRFYTFTPITIDGKEQFFTQWGRGILLEKDGAQYILTPYHVLVFAEPEIIPPPPGVPDFPKELLPPVIVKTGPEQTKIGPNIFLERIFLDEKTNTGLLMVPRGVDLEQLGFGKPLKVKLGKFSELKAGRFVHIFTPSASMFVRSSDLDAKVFGLEMPSNYILDASYDWTGIFLIDKTIGLNEGSFVFAFRDGEPELIGVVISSLGEGFSWVSGIDRMVDIIQKGAGIDLSK